MNMNGLKLTAGAAAVAAALTGAYSLGHANTPAAPQSSPISQPVTAAAALPDMSGIVARNSPSVVNISVSGTRKGSAVDPKHPQLDDDESVQEFFRRFRIPQNRGESPARGLGSGFIVSADGTILTNAHVVEHAEEVIVKLTDKREFKAKVLGLDTTSDVAVLKIDAKDLPAVKIGTAANTRVGEWVLAVHPELGTAVRDEHVESSDLSTDFDLVGIQTYISSSARAASKARAKTCRCRFFAPTSCARLTLLHTASSRGPTMLCSSIS